MFDRGAFTQCSDFDLVLVDTAGRSPNISEGIESLSFFGNMEANHQFYLVLSMTDQKSQIEGSINDFIGLGIGSLIFTKMDESWSFGEFINGMYKWVIPLSWFGIGHKIPEDLERASQERLVERILGI